MWPLQRREAKGAAEWRNTNYSWLGSGCDSCLACCAIVVAAPPISMIGLVAVKGRLAWCSVVAELHFAGVHQRRVVD